MHLWSLCHRTYAFCSNNLFLHKEFKILTIFFITGSRSICFRMKFTIFSTPNTLPHRSIKLLISNNIMSISFPYFDCKSEKLKFEFMALFSKYFPLTKLNVVITNSFKIGCMFHYKDVVPKSIRTLGTRVHKRYKRVLSTMMLQ